MDFEKIVNLLGFTTSILLLFTALYGNFKYHKIIVNKIDTLLTKIKLK